MFPTAYGQIRFMVNSECSRFPYFGGTDRFLRSNLQFWVYELGGGGGGLGGGGPFGFLELSWAGWFHVGIEPMEPLGMLS